MQQPGVAGLGPPERWEEDVFAAPATLFLPVVAPLVTVPAEHVAALTRSDRDRALFAEVSAAARALDAAVAKHVRLGVEAQHIQQAQEATQPPGSSLARKLSVAARASQEALAHASRDVDAAFALLDDVRRRAALLGEHSMGLLRDMEGVPGLESLLQSRRVLAQCQVEVARRLGLVAAAQGLHRLAPFPSLPVAGFGGPAPAAGAGQARQARGSGRRGQEGPSRPWSPVSATDRRGSPAPNTPGARATSDPSELSLTGITRGIEAPASVHGAFRATAPARAPAKAPAKAPARAPERGPARAPAPASTPAPPPVHSTAPAAAPRPVAAPAPSPAPSPAPPTPPGPSTAPAALPDRHAARAGGASSGSLARADDGACPVPTPPPPGGSQGLEDNGTPQELLLQALLKSQKDSNSPNRLRQQQAGGAAVADRGPTQVAAATGRGDALADVCPNLVGSTSSEGPGSRGSKAGLGLSQDEAGPPLGQVAGVAGSDGGLGKRGPGSQQDAERERKRARGGGEWALGLEPRAAGDSRHDGPWPAFASQPWGSRGGGGEGGPSAHGADADDGTAVPETPRGLPGAGSGEDALRGLGAITPGVDTPSGRETPGTDAVRYQRHTQFVLGECQTTVSPHATPLSVVPTPGGGEAPRGRVPSQSSVGR